MAKGEWRGLAFPMSGNLPEREIDVSIIMLRRTHFSGGKSQRARIETTPWTHPEVARWNYWWAWEQTTLL